MATNFVSSDSIDITKVVEEAPELRPHIMTMANGDFHFFDQMDRPIKLAFWKGTACLMAECPEQQYAVNSFMAKFLAQTLLRLQPKLTTNVTTLIEQLLDVK